MVSLDNVRVEFDGKALFDGISFLIQPKEKVGLVGNNGAGKTTLLHVILGNIKPASGNVHLPSNLKIGYLPQQIEFTDEHEIYNAVFQSLEEISSLKQKIDTISEEITNREDYESENYLNLLNQLNELNEKFSVLGGDNIEAEIKKTLKGLGFADEDMYRPLSEYSGGWRMRVELAKILLRHPDVLLLDEPTNHLDIESIQWFENYLKNFQGSVILISHDRAFLDNITTRTLEINLGKLFDYKVPYSKFVKEKEKRIEHQKAAYENQQKKIKETEEFIERFRYKSHKASLVQSRIKQLEKMEEVQIDDIDTSKVNIRFPNAPRSGRDVVKCSNITKSYGEHKVLDNVDLLVERKESVAFVGKNGEGKTTLAKVIVGDVNYEGEVIIGHNVELGYFAQNQDELLDENKTVLQTMEDFAEGDMRKEARNLLGAFLFQGEDVEKQVKVLSGGERSRLALATLLLRPYNLLILDEPTNHLDMRSKEVLKNALKEYNGTLIVVSHDRDFLDGLVDKVFEFKDKQIKENIGGIYEFLQKKSLENLDDLNAIAPSEKNTSSKNVKGKKSFEQRKEHNKKISRTEKSIHKAEQEIEDIENQLKELKHEMSNPEKQDDVELYHKYEDLQKKYEKKMEEWESFHQQLEQLNNELRDNF
jgi:ATP-binding cassette subfamily F protein 3